jgi:hypothetical protein
MTATRPAAAARLLLVPGLALAGHGNPWRRPDDTALEQFYEENQAQSVDTTSKDEMNGVMTRFAYGRTDDGVSLADAGGSAEGPGGR